MYARPRTATTLPVTKSTLESYDLLDDLIDDYLQPLPASVKTSSVVEITELPQGLPSPPIHSSRPLVLRNQKSTPVLNSNSNPIQHFINPLSLESSVPASSGSKWKAIRDETVYFAGGLISHPFESTKHYSILRHSPPIVYYKGPSTNVAISVFGDRMLPADRSFWIQRKGFSGNMGMAASALMRTTSNWVDVTPSVEAPASSAPEADERAWQRDIKKFSKRASKDKRLSKHIARETCVLRIPAAAADGYLRIVMCTGQGSKKSLCPSPTFRLASTSSDISIFRGASLTTLPVEIGLKAVSVIGNQYAQKMIAPAQAVQSKIKDMQPAIIKDHSEKIARVRLEIEERFNDLDGNFDAARDVTYNRLHEDGTLEDAPSIIGHDSGPEKPFPIPFTGKVVAGTGRGGSQIGTPTANLRDVPSDLLLRLEGIYFGWAMIERTIAIPGVDHSWHEAIITIGPSPYAAPAVVPRKVVTVHMIHDFGEHTTFFNVILKVIIAGFLRPAPKSTVSWLPADHIDAISNDKEVAIASLSRVMWQPQTCLDSLSSEKSQASITDTYVVMRSQIQRQIDNVPMHWAGVRTERAEIKDEAYGQGGFYIRR